jgi:hypothetical protein
MKRKFFSFNALFLSGTLVFLLSLIPNRIEAQTLTTIFSDNFDATSETLATNSWINWSGSISLITSATSNSGTHCVQFNGANNTSCYLRKTVSVTAGKTYIYSAYTSGGKSHNLGYNSTALGDHAGSANTNSAWGQHSVTFKATASEPLTIYVYQWGTGTVWVDDVLLQQQQWNIVASAPNGSVSGTTGLTDPGTSISLTATPNIGFYFVNWTEGGTQVSTSATYNFSASADRNLVANFAVVSAASITVTGTLSPFSSTYGTVSSEQSFSVAGSSLTSDIVVTPPAGFEISLTSGSGFQSSVTLIQSLNSVTATPVYVRLNATAPAATYSAANIGIVTAGTSNSVSCSGTVEKKALSVTGSSIAAKIYNGLNTTGTIIVGTITGFVGTETVTATATGTYPTANNGNQLGTIVYTLVNGTNGGLASNYSLANSTYWAFTNPKQLNITAGAQSVTYGTAASVVTAAGSLTYSGFVNGETAATAITGTATYTTTYTNTTAAGTSGVTITYSSGLTPVNWNYWLNPISGAVTIDVPTSVNKISLSNIQILTNNKKLQINASSLISSVSVYDAFGRVMVRQLPKNTSVSIDMQSIGIYIVETKLENGELSRNKFMIR